MYVRATVVILCVCVSHSLALKRQHCLAEHLSAVFNAQSLSLTPLSPSHTPCPRLLQFPGAFLGFESGGCCCKFAHVQHGHDHHYHLLFCWTSATNIVSFFCAGLAAQGTPSGYASGFPYPPPPPPPKKTTTKNTHQISR